MIKHINVYKINPSPQGMGMLGGLFDYDGTIADTKGRQFEWYKEWARQNSLGLNFMNGELVKQDDLEGFLQQYNKVISEKGIVATYNSFGLPCDYDAKDSRVWNAYNNFKRTNPVKIFAGMEDAIRDIWRMGRLNSDTSRNRSLRLAINTTNNWGSIYPDLERFGIASYFDSYCTAEVLKRFIGDGGKYEGINKPSKVSVALMLDILGSRGETTFHIGDTIPDLRASYDVRRHLEIRGERLITIGVSWGFDGGEVLRKGYNIRNDAGEEIGTINFDYIADKPSQIPEIVREII